jgi:DNA-binding IclR family transcriptional regulator
MTLLDCFTQTRTRLRVADFVRSSGLGQSTVSRQLSTLEHLGLLERTDDGQYRLGTQLMTLAGIALNDSAAHRESRGVAFRLACDLGLGANVAQRSDAQLLWLLNFDGEHAPRPFTLMGRRGPLHATGLGKALLSDLSAGEVDELLPTLAPFTRNTLTDHDEFHSALEHVRQYGYATEVEELAFGRACVAAPIRDHTGNAVAALSVSGPLSAMALPRREQELSNRVVEAADAISVALGFVPRLTDAPASAATP